jgi:hypothetical protein
MLKQIKNTEDVIIFAKQIVKEGVSFHCDDDFNDYVNLKTKQQTYTKQEAAFRNNLMDECFEVCEKTGVDIYVVMSEVLINETGLNKLMPTAA